MAYSNIENDSFMDDHQLSSFMSFNELATTSVWINEDLLFLDLDNPTNHSNTLADNQPDYPLHGIEDIDITHSQLFDINLSEYIDSMAILPINNSVDKNPPPTEENPTKSIVVKSSETKNTTDFTNGIEFVPTGQVLQLTVPPFPYQRARYKRELEKVLRYIFVAHNASLTLTILNLQNIIRPGISYFVRITRTTIPYGSDNLILCHPYAIWAKDKDARVHNGSLFMPVTGETIEIDNLVLSRSKQDVLGKIKQFPIFAPNQLELNTFHVINKSKAKDIIKEYNLQYSVLHFQIFLVDQNNKAYPTDLECQTEPMYEFEGKELNNLPEDVRDIMKQSVKRKRIGQQNGSLIKINNKKMATNIRVPEWPHPQVEDNLLPIK